MPIHAADGRPICLSSRDLPAAERVPFWREVFGRQIAHIDIEPDRDQPFCMEATLRAFPGLRLHASGTTSPLRLSRPREMLADGNDDLAFLTNMRGAMAGQHRGRNVEVGIGGAVLFSHAEPSSLSHGVSAVHGLIIERRLLAPLVRDLDDRTARPIPAGNDALRLLHHYLGNAALDGLAEAGPDIRHAFVTHVCDLVALALGATRDGTVVALQRGGRAARLQAIMADIAAHLGGGDLSVAAVAGRHGITPRHLHRLFESQGATFSQIVLGARLDLARRLLIDPRRSQLSITEVGFASGFGDLSYFNRAFRRRFGAAPSEIRRQMLARLDG